MNFATLRLTNSKIVSKHDRKKALINEMAKLPSLQGCYHSVASYMLQYTLISTTYRKHEGLPADYLSSYFVSE